MRMTCLRVRRKICWTSQLEPAKRDRVIVSYRTDRRFDQTSHFASSAYSETRSNSFTSSGTIQHPRCARIRIRPDWRTGFGAPEINIAVIAN